MNTKSRYEIHSLVSTQESNQSLLGNDFVTLPRSVMGKLHNNSFSRQKTSYLFKRTILNFYENNDKGLSRKYCSNLIIAQLSL